MAIRLSGCGVLLTAALALAAGPAAAQSQFEKYQKMVA